MSENIQLKNHLNNLKTQNKFAKTKVKQEEDLIKFLQKQLESANKLMNDNE